VPRGPALVRRIAPIAVAATLVTGCEGDPGNPPDANVGAQDAGIVFVPTDAGPGIGDAGISQDAPFTTDDAGR